MRAVFRDFSACAHSPVAFFCDNLMVKNETRGPSFTAMHSLILARSVHGAFKVNLIYRLGGNQGRRSGSFASELKIRHGLLEKHWSMKRGGGSPPPSQIHDTRMRETKEENAPKTRAHSLSRCTFIVPRLDDRPHPAFSTTVTDHTLAGRVPRTAVKAASRPHNDRSISRLCL